MTGRERGHLLGAFAAMVFVGASWGGNVPVSKVMLAHFDLIPLSAIRCMEPVGVRLKPLKKAYRRGWRALGGRHCTRARSVLFIRDRARNCISNAPCPTI